MRGAQAYNWQFPEDEDETEDLELEAEGPDIGAPSASNSPIPNLPRFQSEAFFSYSYDYRQSLRPRRTPVTLPGFVEKLLALLSTHWITIGGLGLLIFGWLLLGNVLSMLTHHETPEIYRFSGSAVAPESKPPTAASLTTNGSNYAVLGSPTLTPARIETILRQYNSPALGSGQAMYDLGLRYGIDPAFALAFFIHESSAGTQGVAVNTKSIGNIRCTPGYQCLQTSGNGSFRKYVSWEAGIEDWYKLIKELYIGKWGLKTLGQIIPVYAPSADKNNPASYIQHVAQLVEGWKVKQ